MVTDRPSSRRALAIAAVLAVRLAVVTPLSAQEGSTTGALHLLSQSAGLELRDHLNRPVSRRALSRGLREGTELMRREAAAHSSLPGRRAWLEHMERAALLLAVLRSERPGGPVRRSAFVQRPPREPKPRRLHPQASNNPVLEACSLCPTARGAPPAVRPSSHRVLLL